MSIESFMYLRIKQFFAKRFWYCFYCFLYQTRIQKVFKGNEEKRAVGVYILEKLHASSYRHVYTWKSNNSNSFFPFPFICFNLFHYDCTFFQNSKEEELSTYPTPSESVNASNAFLKARISQFLFCFSYRFPTI